MPRLKLFEAFAGVGSQRMALRNIGADFESVGIMEVDRYGLLAYAAIHEGLDWEGPLPTDAEMLQYMNQLHIAYNFSTDKSELPETHEDIAKLYIASVKAKNYGDIRLASTEKLPDMDFFTYSFPCKDFSIAGLRKGAEKGSGTRSALVWECERIIEAKRPTYLMMENVPGMVDQVNIHILQQWCSILEELGYKNYWKVLNSANYGTPQRRRRVIMFSVLKDKEAGPFMFDLGNQVHKLKLQDILIEGKAPEGCYIDQEKHPCKLEPRPKTNGFFSISLTPDTLIIKGRYPTAYEMSSRIYDPAGACPTIQAMTDYSEDFSKSKGVSIKIWDNWGPRALMPIEAWRAQNYLDEDYYKAEAAGIDRRHLYERAGRGICISMLEAQYKRLFKEYLVNA